MTVLRKLLRTFRKRNRKNQLDSEQPNVDDAPTIQDSLAIAAHQEFAVDSKIQNASDAVMLEQLRQIANDEINTVARYREKKVFGNNDTNSYQPTSPGDLILADEMNFTFPMPESRKISPLLTGLLGISIGLVPIAGIVGYLLANKKESIETKEPEVIQKNITEIHDWRLGQPQDIPPK